MAVRKPPTRTPTASQRTRSSVPLSSDEPATTAVGVARGELVRAGVATAVAVGVGAAELWAGLGDRLTNAVGVGGGGKVADALGTGEGEDEGEGDAPEAGAHRVAAGAS